MRFVYIGILLMGVALVVGCRYDPTDDAPRDFPRPQQSVPTNRISEELVINGIGLGSTAEEVHRLLGAADKSVKHTQQNVEFLTYTLRGLVLGISGDERVHTIAVTAPALARTSQGVGIGSAGDDVVKAYGPTDTTWRYKLGEHDGDSIRIMFTVKDQQVTKIYLAWGYE